MKKITAAFATDEGDTLIDRHFGDSKRYSIYEISSSDEVFIRNVENLTALEEEIHADPRKAKGVAGLLKKHGVQAAVSKVFGPNIEKIKKHFVCVIVSGGTVKNSVATVKENLDAIITQWERGGERDPIDMRKQYPYG